MDLIEELLNWFTLTNQKQALYGQLGDYIGGIFGTVISVFALVFVWRTWSTTSQAYRLQSVMALLVEMLKTHDTISGSGEFSFWERRGVPSIILREFNIVYKITTKMVPSYDVWSVEDRVNISYTFVYYGMSTQAVHSLSQYDQGLVKIIQDSVTRKRNLLGGRARGTFAGHQVIISNYFRNLFAMYAFIDGSKLSLNNKIELSKLVRTKLSNYDQAILALNVISHLGSEWENRGFSEKYKPFGNVPERFFNFDARFSISERFPLVEFEWMSNRKGSRNRLRGIYIGRLCLYFRWLNA